MFFLFLAVLQILPAVKPKHLTLAATTSAAAAAPGARLTLYLDVKPNPGIHVYAPGAKDYQPIAIKLDKRTGVVAGRVVYPKSQALEFEGQRIPVYDAAFRLTQEITLARSLAPGAVVTLTGTVTYQACDDRVCFFPETVPVAWTIAAR